MRVVIHLTKFYDWVPVPRDVAITPEDIASGRLMPGKEGGFRTQVVKIPKDGTHRICMISEADIIGKIIHEKTDVRRAGRLFTRKEAVAHFIMDHLLEGQAEWSWISKIEVHDSGPDEKLLRDMLDPHTKAVHGRRGGPNIDPSTVESHVAAYIESVDSDGHAAHLEQHFGVRKVS